MKYNYTIANNSNQSVQTDSSNDENDASENVQTIYSVPVSIFYVLSRYYLGWWPICFHRFLEQL